MTNETYTYKIATYGIIAATLLMTIVVSTPIGYAMWLAFRSM